MFLKNTQHNSCLHLLFINAAVKWGRNGDRTAFRDGRAAENWKRLRLVSKTPLEEKDLCFFPFFFLVPSQHKDPLSVLIYLLPVFSVRERGEEQGYCVCAVILTF